MQVTPPPPPNTHTHCCLPIANNRLCRLPLPPGPRLTHSAVYQTVQATYTHTPSTPTQYCLQAPTVESSFVGYSRPSISQPRPSTQTTHTGAGLDPKPQASPSVANLKRGEITGMISFWLQCFILFLVCFFFFRGGGGGG